MKKALIALATISFSVSAYADISYSEKESLCGQATVDDPWLQRPTVYTGNIFEGSSKRYVSTAEPASFEAEQNHFVDYDGGVPEYRTTRDFAFFKSFGQWSTLQLVRGMTSDEDVEISFPIRGEHRAVVLVKDEDLRQPNGPGGDYWYPPLCDVVEVIAHNDPSVGAASATSGAGISVNIANVDIDSLSARAQQGYDASITYIFRHQRDRNTEFTYTTTSPDITFTPTYQGSYYVFVRVSDGNLTKFIDVTEGVPVFSSSGQPLPGGPIEVF
ncbi:hypothetical protein [Idiomarina fontislapidosi]|uniref:Uncharacterized protein n=1 Tax=Idiomarina fontislapidosi TaxID=263723 RepID=A0A432XYU5_9GAMM|nr:hypothetical protein [Idiomarina fontislapidosi]RUO53751.1 hypothetical protein CWE25_07630 [Idiomarina fontislapidosi]